MRKRRQETSQQQQPRQARAHGEEEPLHAAAKATAPPQQTSSHDPLERIVATSVPLILAAIVFGVYVQTLYPSIAGGDSGELVAESCHLGVSHPPGYPLFNMAVHAFALQLPWSAVDAGSTTIAWRANLFSAACDTAAAVLIYYCVLHWTTRASSYCARHVPAFTAAVLWSFSPLIWTYAVGAEVFALNNLFAALLVYVLLHYARHRSLRLALVGAFVSGLALTNQHTIVLFELPIVSYVLYTRRHLLLRNFELVQLSAAFVAGLLPYIYLPLAMSLNPQPGSWGDVTTLRGWFHHVRRGDYGTFRLFSTHEAHEGLTTRLWLYARDLSAREIPLHLAAPVLLLGVVSSLRQRQQSRTSSTDAAVGPTVSCLLLATYAFYMLVFHALANLPLSEGLTYGVHMRFWQQPNVVVFIYLGIGLREALGLVQWLADHLLPRTFAEVVLLLARASCLALVVVQLVTWHALCDQHDAFFVRNYAAALLDPLPRDAVLIVNFDLQWTAIRYLQRCEHRRPDVTVLNLSMMTFAWFATKHAHYPTLSFPGTRLVPFGTASSNDGFTFASFLDANYAPLSSATDVSDNSAHHRRGIFFGGKLNYDDADFRAAYEFIPFGLVDEIHHKRDAAASPTLELGPWYAAQQRVHALVAVRLPALPPLEQYNDETWEWTIARDYGMKTLSWSTFLLERTIASDPQNVTLLAEATHAMERAVQFEPRSFWSPVATLKNLGLAYAQIVKSPQEFSDRSDPFYNDIVGANVVDVRKYKDRASARMLEVWDAWLHLPDARRDAGFDAIERVVRQFVPDATANKIQTKSKKTKKESKAKKTKKKSKGKKTKT